MELDNAKKFVKRNLKRKVSITKALVVALLLGTGFYAEAAAPIIADGTTEILMGDTIEDAPEDAMKAINGGFIINQGRIITPTKNGMLADGAGTRGYNLYLISGSGEDGMRAENGGLVINYFGSSKIIGSERIGMAAAGEDSVAINYGLIKYSGLGMAAAAGGTVENRDDGRIYYSRGTFNLSGFDVGFGMGAALGSTAINEGIIRYSIGEGDALGFGMVAAFDSKAINHGWVIDSETAGMSAVAGSTAINTGYIWGAGEDGMSAGLGGTVINYGEIKDVGRYKMFATGEGSAAINKGYLGTEGRRQVIMKADDKAKAINYGTIDIDHRRGVGMVAVNGGKAANAGTINLNSYRGTGMYAEGEGSEIRNYGTINLAGSEVYPSYETTYFGYKAPMYGGIINGKDDRGNVGMRARNGARLVNKGEIKFKGN